MPPSAAIATDLKLNGPPHKNPTFLLVLLGSSVSVLGDGFHTVALSLWVYQTTGSAKAMSAVMATQIIVGILLGAVGGTLADRTDRRRLMWSLDLVRGLLVLLIAWLVGRDGTPFTVVLGLTALVAAAGRLRGPAFSASLVHIVGKENVQQAGSLLQVTNTSAQVLGPMLGGVVAGAWGGWAALMGDAATFFVSAVCILMAGYFPSPRQAGTEQNPFWKDLVDGFRYISRSPLIRDLTILAPVINFFGNGAFILLTVIALKVWQAQPKEFGIFEGTLPLGFALGAIVLLSLGKRVKRRGVLMCCASMLIGPGLALITGVSTVVAALPILLGIGMLLSVSNVLLSVAMQTEVDPDLQGRVFGTINSLVNLVSPLGIILAGFTADIFGPKPVMLIAAGFISLFGAIGLVSFRGLRDYN